MLGRVLPVNEHFQRNRLSLHVLKNMRQSEVDFLLCHHSPFMSLHAPAKLRIPCATSRRRHFAIAESDPDATDRIVAALHFMNDGRELRSASLCLG
jgi:hypothetical protein